jgi:hypothetical protein
LSHTQYEITDNLIGQLSHSFFDDRIESGQLPLLRSSRVDILTLTSSSNSDGVQVRNAMPFLSIVEHISSELGSQWQVCLGLQSRRRSTECVESVYESSELYELEAVKNSHSSEWVASGRPRSTLQDTMAQNCVHIPSTVRVQHARRPAIMMMTNTSSGRVNHERGACTSVKGTVAIGCSLSQYYDLSFRLVRFHQLVRFNDLIQLEYLPDLQR